jgi:hypothetical protein
VGLTSDYAGHVVPFGPLPEIGAYELSPLTDMWLSGGSLMLLGVGK